MDRLSRETAVAIQSAARSLERISLIEELRELTMVPSNEWTHQMQQRWDYIFIALNWRPRGVRETRYGSDAG